MAIAVSSIEKIREWYLPEKLYRDAKTAEAKRDYAMAHMKYYLAVAQTPQNRSLVKDFAGFLHMTGRSDHAVTVLQDIRHKPRRLRDDTSYFNLLEQIEQSRENARKNINCPRTLIFETLGPSASFVIDPVSVVHLVPNPCAVVGVYPVNPSGYSNRAFIELNTKTAASKCIPSPGKRACLASTPSERGAEMNANSGVYEREGICFRVAWAPTCAQFALFPYQVIDSEEHWEQCFSRAGPPSPAVTEAPFDEE